MTRQSPWRLTLVAAVAIRVLACACQPAAAAADENPPPISDGVVKIGLILDMAGPYSNATGIGSATAARMAIEDFGGQVLGAPIEALVADHGNSPDRAASIARDWLGNQQVDAIMDVSGSSEALIVQAIANTRNKIVSLSGPGAVRLTNEACTPTSMHYVFDTRSIARTIGSSLVARGDDSWFFITADYSFGYDLESDTAAVVTAAGGQVVGRARHPFEAHDFSSYLARAQQSHAKVIALANAGTDTDDTIKQAAHLGMPGTQLFAALALRIQNVHALGLQASQGLMMSESFYWDMNDATRAWSKRFFDRVGKMPNSLQAGVYSSTMHYLRAVARAGTDATGPVMQVMRTTPIDDFFAHGQIRADGVMVHDVRLFQVKSPAESHYAWDYFKLLETIPGDTAFAPIGTSKCPLMKP
jgi:branched-chain amino acid transport system substrate-binding protein